MRKRKTRKYLILLIITVFVVIRIDNKKPHVFRSRMSPETYRTFHGELQKIQLSSEKGYAKVSEGVEYGKDELLDARFKEVRGSFVPPVKGYRISCDFGFRFHPVFFWPEWHRGIDLACPEGNPVYATYSGTVYEVGERGRNGVFVKIRHSQGYSSAYVHLQSYCVKKGQAVSTGQLIGKSGNTGTSTGPHLHFAIKKDNRAINPEYIIDL